MGVVGDEKLGKLEGPPLPPPTCATRDTSYDCFTQRLGNVLFVFILANIKIRFRIGGIYYMILPSYEQAAVNVRNRRF